MSTAKRRMIMSKCEKCKHNHDEDFFVCDICIHNTSLKDKFEPLTNADRIRAMSDEELMRFLFNEVSNNTICSFCVPTMRTKCKCDGHCKNGILEWLKQPAEVSL